MRARRRIFGIASLPSLTRSDLAGGSLDLRELLAALRDRFSFRDHPDFRADWEMLLRRSREAMADVETHIANLAQLPRSDDRTSIRRRLASAGMCLLVGKSGSGKSALAKEISLADYPRTIWLTANVLDHEFASGLRARSRTYAIRSSTSCVRLLRDASSSSTGLRPTPNARCA